MQPKSVWEYISLGISIGSLRFWQILPKQWFNEPDDSPEIDLSVVSPDELIETFEKLDLLGARGIARLMKGEKAQFFKDVGFHYLDALISVLESESDRIQVFIVPQTRFDDKKLLNNPSALFASGVYSSMHEVAQYDFAQAGKCIVFEVPTAAAFHLMRGTEMILRQLYSSITGKDAGKKFWGQIIDELHNNQTQALPKTLFDHLNNIRENFRNPTQHPDKIYDIDEAQDLFGVCIDVVDQMVPLIWQQKDKIL